ncbi:hypothetical protein [Glaciihabitans sp. UYNi722]
MILAAIAWGALAIAAVTAARMVDPAANAQAIDRADQNGSAASNWFASY